MGPLLGAFERLIGRPQQPPPPTPPMLPHAALDNGTGPQTAPIPSFIGNQYATNPDAQQFQGIDPRIFGYPGDQNVMGQAHKPVFQIPNASGPAHVLLTPAQRGRDNLPIYGA